MVQRASIGSSWEWLGSTLELQTQLVIAERLGLGDAEQRREVEDLSHEVGKMLWALGKKL